MLSVDIFAATSAKLTSECSQCLYSAVQGLNEDANAVQTATGEKVSFHNAMHAAVDGTLG